MILKPGVKTRGLQPEMLLGLVIIDGVWTRMAIGPVVVTSITDGKHGENSLHYKGQAVDIRIRDYLTETLGAVVNMCKESLGSDYDVVLEKDHIHVEYDPK